HEFKNSLATIHGYIQLLEAQSDGAASFADRRLTLDSTLTEVKLLSKLVTDFLNFARPQDLNLSKVDLHAILQTSVTEVRHLLAEHGIELRVKGEFAVIAGDESLLCRVFINLLRNAVEAIDPHSIRKGIVVVRTVDQGPDQRYAHVTVSDTGIGIS